MQIGGATDANLLVALHEGVFETPPWQTFLERLRAQTRASYASLIFRPTEGMPSIQLFAGEQLSPPFRRLFEERYGDDPLPYRAMRPGRVYAGEELIDPANARHRALFDEVLIPAGMRHIRTMRVTEESGTDAWLTIITAQPSPASGSALLGRIAPHLRAALRCFMALERERLRSAISGEAMSRLNFGWLTLDDRCRILDATSNVDAILKRTSLLRRGRYDRLTFASPALDREVEALVRGFAHDPEARPRAINLSQDPWMDMLVAPVPADAASPGSTATAIVYLSGDRQSRSDRCEQLVELFGLLPSEARLAWAIAQGRSIARAAEELGLTIETARSYSKRVYSKTGATGQASLVRIIFTSVLAIA